MAVALLLGPTARPLATWAGLPISGEGCDCPPAHCHCAHGTAAAGGDHAGRPSCPLPPAAGRGGDPGRPTAGRSTAGRHAAAHTAVPQTALAAPAAAPHAAHPAGPVGPVVDHAAHAVAVRGRAAAGCSITSRCGDEPSPAAATVGWLQAAAGPAGWAAPGGPGDLSPPAAGARLLDLGRSPELPPPRRIVPIA